MLVKLISGRVFTCKIQIMCFQTRNYSILWDTTQTGKSTTIDLLLLAVTDRKRVGFSLILLCKNRFGFQSELAESKLAKSLLLKIMSLH